MTNPKLPSSLPEDENMDPVGEPYPEQEPLNPSDGTHPSEQQPKPFNDEDKKKGEDFGRDTDLIQPFE